MRRSISETIGTAVSIIGLVLVTWIIASWVDVILHNTNDFLYQSWNLFTMLCQ